MERNRSSRTLAADQNVTTLDNAIGMSAPARRHCGQMCVCAKERGTEVSFSAPQSSREPSIETSAASSTPCHRALSDKHDGSQASQSRWVGRLTALVLHGA